MKAILKNILTAILAVCCQYGFAQDKVEGRILGADGENSPSGLSGANVYWLNSQIGTVTDTEGDFSIPYRKEFNQLVISFIGFTTDTLTVNAPKTITHLLQPSNVLDEVVVEQKKDAVQKAFLSARNVITVNSAELLKAACCNLSESFETNPAIDVNFSDALTGTKQIQMLGLTSPYLLITQENIPMVRGASQAYGLTFTPGTWVESIQITKGAGSVVNGYESISGQINTELMKPLTDKLLFVNGYANQNGRLELNAHINRRLSEQWSTGFYIHGNQRTTEEDGNGDGFLDAPLADQINVMNRWQYQNPVTGWVSFIDVRFLNDEKQVGQTGFDADRWRGILGIPSGTGVPNTPALRLHSGHVLNETGPPALRLRSGHVPSGVEGPVLSGVEGPVLSGVEAWGSEIDTRRFDSSVKLGYVFPELPFQSFGFQASYSLHKQNAYYGFRQYDIDHESLYGNLIFNSILGSTQNQFKTGLNLAYDGYRERVDNRNFQRDDRAIGAFFEYSYEDLEKLSFTAGFRIDTHNRLGVFATPRFHLRYTPWEKASWRFSVGRGKRAANIFAENQQLFASARSVQLLDAGGAVYGLDPEIAWNYGFGFLQGFTLFDRKGTVSLDFYRTDFENQVVVDWENPRAIFFYNLDGKSIADSFQIELNYEVLKQLELRTAYKYYNVRTDYRSGRLQKPLQPPHRFFVNVGYETTAKDTGAQWRFDYTLNILGGQRLPSTGVNPPEARLGDEVDGYSLMNAQVTKVFSKHFEFYIGGENLSDFKQPNPVLGAADPFGANFDTTIVYAPIMGRMFYGGFRYKL
ncbi:TonB-dependent receptor [Maribacter sp. 2-571]|uniref:TonB-dependent receptor n=1 Tax=Maribacter sp. 2-571 TaxID=3417569 RepID=UPI003D32DE48